ncbi:site-specific DNA-methyltransferase [Methylobacterium radiotolerans]|uniref:site-specific DNA-methyltransferase n=1 Tax=Methylobacterium radiotolerans TaxID=31998 RepID=UPI0015F4FE5A|nr:DNA methyltransferase [Methylobacterium radiotolerans]
MKSWPADHVERRPISALVPYARNARTHSDEQVDQIAASINEWGWTTPVLIDEESGIISGHGRMLAAAKLGIADVPVMVARGWSEAQRRAYCIADNQLAANAGWDRDLLRVEFGALQELDFDIALTGFSIEAVADLMAERTAGLTDPDDVPEAPVEPVTRECDIWCLGRHRLLCGDSTNANDVDAALAGIVPHLMVTDPPYGVEYEPDWRNQVKRANGTRVAARAIGRVLNDDRADWRAAWALFLGDVAYVWHASLFSPLVAASLTACDFQLRSSIIWAKGRFAIGRGDYHWQHEPCWYAVRKGKKGHWSGDRKQSTLWEISHSRSETGHSTQKPVECMKRPIENNSSPGQAVYEPFCGSGTTIIAAEMTGRACHAIELNPVYVDVAVLRWQAFTGQEATLAETGETFARVKARLGSTN